MSAALTLAHVTAGYGPLTILDDLSLELRSDEVLLVLGANGSGKSTVLKTIMGLTRRTAGSVAIAGTDITGWPAHRRAGAGIGYVPQTGNVFSDLTVTENLRMGAWLRPEGPEPMLPRIFELFPRLAERLEAKAGALSGGERRMLSIALTLAASPTVLLLDEPSSDLAPVMIDQVFSAIAAIRAAGIPVLLVEQNVARGLGLATRVLVMVRGRIAAEMAADAVRDDDLHALFLHGTHAPA